MEAALLQVSKAKLAMMEPNLKAWIAKGTTSEQRKKAATCMRQACTYSYSYLGLNGLNLSSLPECVCLFTQVLELDLDENNFSTLPPQIKFLTRLKRLELYHNKFKSIPSVIFELSKLERLNLCRNELTDVSPGIRQLTKLHSLFLDVNKLTIFPTPILQLSELTFLGVAYNNLAVLPSEIGQLLNLKRIGINGNPKLNALPLSFGQILNLNGIDIDYTLIPEEQRRNILAQCLVAWRKYMGTNLSILLKAWKESAESKINITRFEGFTNTQKWHLEKWLFRLEETSDFAFRQSQQKLIKTACHMLQTVLNDPQFKEDFFIQVEANNENCEDRAAMSFNILYGMWRLATLPETATLKEKLTLMTQSAKTLALRTILANKIVKHQEQRSSLAPPNRAFVEAEAIEIYLYYENILHRKLDLLTFIKHTAHAEVIGNRSWIKQEELIKEVNASFFMQLIKLPAFEKEIQKVSSIQAIKQKYTNRMSRLEAKKTYRQR